MNSFDPLVYAELTAATDQLPREATSALLGLNGEVGSVLSALKKHRRDTTPANQFALTLEEELGDCLWYITALCHRFDKALPALLDEVKQRHILPADGLEDALAELCLNSAKLLSDHRDKRGPQELLPVVTSYLRVLASLNLEFDDIARKNLEKVTSRFEGTWVSTLETFDTDAPADEQLPRNFEIEIIAKTKTLSYLSINGIKIGDSLKDNIKDNDGYRFHDVFHLANAAILGWSPVLRSILKLKRKYSSKIDETEDSGRAIAIEEGLSAWLFSKSKQYNYFANYKSLPYDLISTAREFVSGFEAERCPAWLWQKSILNAYEVFRQVRDSGQGIVVGNFAQRSLSFRPTA